MSIRRTALRAMTGATALIGAAMIAACGGNDGMAPMAPTPPTGMVTVNAYILPGATTRGNQAFGDEPLVVYTGERLRWVNLDTLAHALVTDTPGATDFLETDALPPGGEQSFIMTKTGTTTFHCTIHPEMVGTLMVRDR